MSLRVPIELFDELKKLANKNRCSISDAAVRIMYAGLEREDQPSPSELLDFSNRLEVVEKEIARMNRRRRSEPPSDNPEDWQPRPPRQKLPFPQGWEELSVDKLRRLARGRLSKVEFLSREPLIQGIKAYLEEHPDEKP